tara:strand:- start:557 stop:829 length:273 start_codon:yes stop_codon:yes gene_type:complete
MAYSPYKMKGHTLPGIKQSPAKGYGHKSPAKKELVGDQHNLPEELKSKIKAAPGKMYGKESPAKIAPLVAMAGKAVAGKVAGKAVDKMMG